MLTDWLEENDDPRRAELLRLHRSLLATCCQPEYPGRAARHARMVELLGQGVRPCVPQETLQIAEGVDMTFSFIPPHTFRMGREKGSWREVPVHTVTLTRGYYLGIHPVTQAQWEAVTGENASYFKGADRPVEEVTWGQSQGFCKEVSKRTRRELSLPTSAQWEWGCRAGTTTEFHTGEGEAAMQKAGWYYGNGVAGTIKETLPVGRLLPNAWGLFDTHGNVWEYCLDWYEEYKPGGTTDPTGPASGIRRVMRGGCFGILAEYCGSAYSDEYDPTMSGSGIGFRVALALRDE